MGGGMVGYGTSATIPSAQTRVPMSDYPTPPPPTTGVSGSAATTAVPAGVHCSFNTSASLGNSDSDDHPDDVGSNPTNTRKRKRGGSDDAGVSGSTSREMLYILQGLMSQVIERQEATQQRFLEAIEKRVMEKQEALQQQFLETIEKREQGLMNQVMEKQEAMQQRFLETIEKREQDRILREEAWKRQEMARLIREHEMMAQDRAISASRHAAVIAFFQQITGQAIQLPSPRINPTAPPQQPQSVPPAAALAPQSSEVIITHHHQPTSTDHDGFEAASSSWTDKEVFALIELKCRLNSSYGPTRYWPHWGEVSAEMSRMGYNRRAKTCREKWGNLNQYYKRIKEQRPELSRTWAYFSQLDALHQKKVHGGSNQASPTDHNQSSNTSLSTGGAPNQTSTILQTIIAPPPPPPQTNTNVSANSSINNNNNPIHIHSPALPLFF